MHKETPDIERPWGGYTILKKTASFWVKKLFVHKDERLSLQSHQYREEIWYVLSGKIIATVGNNTHEAHTGDVVIVPKNTKHRITGITQACILEVAFGKVLERDIDRYEDDYGRSSK
jgi:mannose-6-phosphate isomerase